MYQLQYIPINMHTVFALLCFVVVIHWLTFPYPSGLLHWHCGNLTIAQVPAKQPWWIWINTSCEFIMNDWITTTKQSTTKPCAYFLGYTVQHAKLYAIKWSNVHRNMAIVFFPGLDRFIPDFDRFILGFDRFIPASINVMGTYPQQSKWTFLDKMCILFVFWYRYVLFYLKWIFCNLHEKPVSILRTHIFLKKYSWHHTRNSMTHFSAIGCRLWPTGSDRSQSNVINSMQDESSEIATVQVSRTEYIMQFITAWVAIRPWNQRESHSFNRWPHIWNSRTSGASRHQNTGEHMLKQKLYLHQVGDSIKRHTELFKYGYISSLCRTRHFRWKGHCVPEIQLLNTPHDRRRCHETVMPLWYFD